MKYQASIYFDTAEDNYKEGELEAGTSWEEVLTADTPAELRNKVLEATYSNWQDLNDEQINEYDWCTEYWTTYLANANNEGEADEAEIKLWKQGKLKLWAVHCQILVTKIIEEKGSLV